MRIAEWWTPFLPILVFLGLCVLDLSTNTCQTATHHVISRERKVPEIQYQNWWESCPHHVQQSASVVSRSKGGAEKVKIQDRKMTDKMSGVENAGL